MDHPHHEILRCVSFTLKVFLINSLYYSTDYQERSFLKEGDHLKKNEGGSKCEEKYDKTDRKHFVSCLTFIYTFDLIFQVHGESEVREKRK